MNIINGDEVDSWLFEHIVIQGHACDGIKGTIQGVEPGHVNGDLCNIAFIDTITGEEIDILYV